MAPALSTPMDLLSHDALVRLTATGDPTFLLCAALGAFFYLWVSHRRRLAGYLALTVGLSVALTIGAKFGFLLAHDPDRAPRLRSPSGHIAIATTVYGCCTMMLTANCGKIGRATWIIVLALFLLALADTRLLLGLHSPPEIVVGFLIGIACLPVFACGIRTSTGPFDGGRLAVLLLLLGVTRFARVDAEEMIAYGARLAMLLTQTSVTVEQTAISYLAVPYRTLRPEVARTVSNACKWRYAIARVGERNGQPLYGGLQCHPSRP